MDNQNGGHQLSPAQRQQNTAAALARQKVLEAYKHQTSNYHSPADKKPVQETAPKPSVTAAKPTVAAKPTTTAITNTATPQIKTEDWRKYHSAWQDYYQKYYGEYYGKAARDYIARERMKYERDAALREAKNKAEAERKAITSNATAGEKDSKAVQADFKAKIQEKVSRRAKKSAQVAPLRTDFGRFDYFDSRSLVPV